MTGLDADLIIAGGGPIGLAAAIDACLAGLSVYVVEPRTAPIDKACGEGLMPGAVQALARLGVHVSGHPFYGIRYIDPRHEVEHRFAMAPGLGVRRPVLHAALAGRAAEVGVRSIRGRVTAVIHRGDVVSAAGLRGRWLFACDGLHSPVRRLLRLDEPAREPRRYGLRRHFCIAPWSDLVEVYWGPRHEAYVTPIAADQVGVALLGPPTGGFAELLPEIPLLSSRLGDAAPVGRVLGAGPLRQAARRRVAGRVLLVGDAGGYVDALTGEGLAVGLAQAHAAVRAVVAGAPESYERAWQDVTRTYRVLTSALVGVATRPRLRRLVVPAAAHLPRVFAAAVESLAR